MLFVNSLYRPDPRGRMASSVFSANQFGNYEKMFKAPKQPRTAAQLLIRNLFLLFTQAWSRALTDAQRLAWNALASRQTKMKNGKTYTIPGHTFYIKTNQSLASVNAARLDIAPTNLSMVMVPTTFTVDVITTPGTEDIKLNIAPVIPAGTKVIISSTGIVNNGAKPRYASAKKLIVLDHTFVSGSSIKDAYEAVFGTIPATGAKVGFTCKAVNTADGVSSGLGITSSIAAI